jgi:MFS family permease
MANGQTQTHQEKMNPGKIRLMSLVSFLFGFSDAFLLYVISSYFREVSGTENVSAFYLAVFGTVLMLLFYLHAFIRRLGKSALLMVLFVLLIAANAALIIVPTSWWSLLPLMAHLVLVNLIWVNLDIVLESFSTDSRSGRIRGLYLTIMNAGLLGAPFLATHVLDWAGFHGLFMGELILVSAVFLAVLIGLRGENRRFNERVTPREILNKVRKKPDILRAYHISFAMEFFYAVMIVYTPIHLLNLGLSWSQIGIVFTVMLLPFVLLQYPLGVLADRDWGEKEMLIVALMLMGVTSGVAVFVTSSNVLVWAATLFLTRVGVAAIEVLRDSYFYKRIDGRDVDVIAFFRTARPVANIAAAVSVGIALWFFPLQAVFALVALNAFISLFSAVTMQDNASESEQEGRELAFDSQA